MRQALGDTRRYAARMDLNRTVPRPDLASTRYCLCNLGGEYLVYLPQGGVTSVDLSEATGSLTVEWFDPRSGRTEPGGEASGGRHCEFRAPFAGQAVLYLILKKPAPPAASRAGS